MANILPTSSIIVLIIGQPLLLETGMHYPLYWNACIEYPWNDNIIWTKQERECQEDVRPRGSLLIIRGAISRLGRNDKKNYPRKFGDEPNGHCAILRQERFLNLPFFHSFTFLR